jgi:capsular polysaccharide biosynthesis protein
MPALVELLRRRWWLIVAIVVLGVLGAGAYARLQRNVYESTATLYIGLSRKSAAHASPAVMESELGVLSYGSLVNTFVSIAESKATLEDAAGTLNIPPNRLSLYTAVVTVRPKSFVLDMSVDGPDRKLVVPLANHMASTVADEVATGFPVVALSSLDAASTSSQIRPKLKRDLVYGALAGLILGFVLAGLSTHMALRVAKRGGEPPGAAGTPVSESGAQTGDAEIPPARAR